MVFISRIILLLALASLPGFALAKGVYLSVADFVALSFDGQTPPAKTLWLSAEQKQAAVEILSHPVRGLRQRYWQQGERSAWIFEEIGKELPITIGVVVERERIRQVMILEFRESRGGEVRHSFFTDQFVGAGLADEQRLSQPIDGITGATLSVRAVKRAARLALYLAGQLTPVVETGDSQP